ncbi:MAG: hypothetical protein ABT27_02705 [Lysobacteraceae bacterium SCN 69-25]|nr:MAG: hypothetical protein ABT27_02705 [Xanthomonadaceae bacterium SCN 69-25]
MSLPLFIAVALAVAALLGIAEMRALEGARRWLGMAAALVAPVLLYFALFPPPQVGRGRELVVLTAGTPADFHVPAGALVVALPGSEAAGVERVADLATALRRHADAQSLHVVGAGLSATDRDAARGLPLRFDAAPLPRGIVALEMPPAVLAGHAFTLRGRVAAATGAQLLLLEPGGRRQGPLAAATDGSFRFDAFAPRAAELSYELQLLDAGGNVLDRVDVPLAVREGRSLRLLLLAGGPDPDLKYLQRWALDAGHRVDARISLSRGIAQQRGETNLSDATLAATDVLIIDERAWSQLDKATRTRVLDAADAGLGVLLRLVAAPSPALLAEWRGLGLALQSAPDAASVHLSGAAEGSVLQRLALSANDASLLPLARDRDGNAFAVARNRGQGRLGAWWLQGSAGLVPSGQAVLHDQLWADALDVLARPRQAPPPSAPAWAWQDERIELCAATPALSVAAADATGAAESPAATGAAGTPGPAGAPRAAVEILTQARGDGRWCGGFWPREPGWHRLQAGDAETLLFVRAAGTAVALHRAETLAAMRALPATATTVRDPQRPGPRWPWFLAWLLPGSLLWWLQRRARRDGSGA